MATKDARYEELIQINHVTIEAIRQAQRDAKTQIGGKLTSIPANTSSSPFQSCPTDQ
jgi:hypothetical protein